MVRALVAASVISVASAASSVVSLYNIGDTKNVVASVISADKTATAYSIACATLNGDSCGMPVGATVTQGPSTWVYTVVFPESPVLVRSLEDNVYDANLALLLVPPYLLAAPLTWLKTRPAAPPLCLLASTTLLARSSPLRPASRRTFRL